MTDEITDNLAPGIVIEIEGEHASFALVDHNGRLDPFSIKRYQTTEFSTLTACVEAFAKAANTSLRDYNCAICMSGAVTGDTVRISGCRWIISVSALKHITGKEPLVMNDSAALAWGTLSPKPSLTHAIGVGATPSLNKPGRWLTINRRTGLGAAALSIDKDGQKHVMPSEAGHIAFAPETEAERSLSEYLHKTNPRVSWELALKTIANPPDDWSINSIRPDRIRCMTIHAEMLGAFAGDTTLAMATWDGVFLHGNVVRFLTQPAHAADFARRFEDKGFYRASIRATPRWVVSDPQAALVGNAYLLAASINKRADS